MDQVRRHPGAEEEAFLPRQAGQRLGQVAKPPLLETRSDSDHRLILDPTNNLPGRSTAAKPIVADTDRTSSFNSDSSTAGQIRLTLMNFVSTSLI